MNMGQRTSSAAELNKGRQAVDDKAFMEALAQDSDINQAFKISWGNPEKSGRIHGCVTGVAEYVHEKYTDPTRVGGRKCFVTSPVTNVISGFKEDVIDVCRSGQERYWTSLLTLSLCEKESIATNTPIHEIAHLFYGRTAEEMIEYFDRREPFLNFEQNWIHALESNPAEGIFVGRCDIPENDLKTIVYVVGNLGRAFTQKETLSTIVEYKEDNRYRWYTSEKVARFAYNDILKGNEPMKSMEGRSRSGLIEHLVKMKK